MSRLVALSLALAAACTAGASPPGELGCRALSRVSVGQRLPDCTFATLDGGEFRLASLDGTPSVVNFWAEWCYACREEMPALERVSQDLDGRVAFVGMDMLGIQGETAAAATRFAEATGVTYTLAFDEGGGLYEHFANPARPAMPLTLFVGPDRRLRGMKFGPMEEAELRALIAEHLDVS